MMASDNNMIRIESEGVLIVNKHSGVTSHDIVGDIRHIYHTKKVGHTGTLDPMAEGVLVVLIGRAAKAAEYLVADQKSYRATLRLGITTDTEDISRWQAGDIVIFKDNKHIGIVSDKRTKEGKCYIIHNGGQPVREEDYLKRGEVLRHYRFDVSAIDSSVLVRWESG